MKCVLSDSDRRTTGQFVQLVDAQGTDYFENLCLKPSQGCKNTRVFPNPRIGVSDEKVAQYVGLHYYTDKELQVTSEPACRLACEIESEFLCRSFLYLGQPQGSQYNCRLYHLDHKTLPDGPSTYLNAERPLIDHGEPTGKYYENVCESKSWKRPHWNCMKTKHFFLESAPSSVAATDPPLLDLTEDPSINNLTRSEANCDKTGTCYDVAVRCKDTRIAVQVRTNKPFNGRIYALGRSETCNIDVINSDEFRLDLTMGGQDCNTQSVVRRLMSVTGHQFNSGQYSLMSIRLAFTQTQWCYNITALSWQRQTKSTRLSARMTWVRRISHSEWCQFGMLTIIVKRSSADQGQSRQCYNSNWSAIWLFKEDHSGIVWRVLQFWAITY